MARRLLLLLLLTAGCSKGPQADLPYISEARSLAAEWALVNEQAAQGKLTAVERIEPRDQKTHAAHRLRR